MKTGKIVIKIGGSISIAANGPDFSYFSKLLPVLRRLKKRNQIIVAVGGGALTRVYGKSIEKFRLSDKEKEKIFIELISANVRFLAAALKMKPIPSLDEIRSSTSGVIGGIAPGRSTDANAAAAAKKIKADLFIKLTDVGGIYDKDPKKFRNARLIRKMSFRDLTKFAKKGSPNSYGILDSTAIKTLADAKIKTAIISGRNPKNIEKALQGVHVGTIID